MAGLALLEMLIAECESVHVHYQNMGNSLIQCQCMVTESADQGFLEIQLRQIEARFLANNAQLQDLYIRVNVVKNELAEADRIRNLQIAAERERVRNAEMDYFHNLQVVATEAARADAQRKELAEQEREHLLQVAATEAARADAQRKKLAEAAQERKRLLEVAATETARADALSTELAKAKRHTATLEAERVQLTATKKEEQRLREAGEQRLRVERDRQSREDKDRELRVKEERQLHEQRVRQLREQAESLLRELKEYSLNKKETVVKKPILVYNTPTGRTTFTEDECKAMVEFCKKYPNDRADDIIDLKHWFKENNVDFKITRTDQKWADKLGRVRKTGQ